MIKKKVVALSLLCLSLGAVVLSNPKNSNNSVGDVEVFADVRFTDGDFINVENFFYSGKGFITEFTFGKPTKDKTTGFNFLGGDSGWKRLTDPFSITFKANGQVTSTMGKVFEINGHYYYKLMFSELSGHLNTDEGVTGHENLSSFYFPDGDGVDLKFINTQIIENNLISYPITSVRSDAIPGLTFKAFIPSIPQSAELRMAIVPSSYLAGLNENYIEKFVEQEKSFIDLECSPVALKSTDELYKLFGAGYEIKGSVTNILEDNYQVPFVAIPYYKVNGVRHYASLIRQTRSNYYDKCLEMKKTAGYSSLSQSVRKHIENVIYKCEHHIVKESIGNIKAYFPYNTEKVFKVDALPNELKTENVMYSAKRETERGQLVINVPDNFNKKYYVTAEPFVKTNDNSKVIGTENISFEQQLYQNVKTNWSVVDDQPKGWYPNNKPEGHLQLGYTPDALLPFDVAFDANENVLTSRNGKNNAISYTIKVPEDAEAGEYKSKIVVRIDGVGTLALPITLNVFDFTLPKENKAKYTIIVNQQETKALYGDDSISSIYHLTAFETLAERGVSGGLAPATTWQKSDLEAYIRKVKEVAADDRVPVYFLPNASSNVYLTVKIKKNFFQTETINIDGLPIYRVEDTPYNGTITLPGLKTILRELIKASTNELDLIKKGIFYYPQADEPGSKKDKLLQNIFCQNVVFRCRDELLEEDLFTGKEKVKESLKKLAYIVTSYPRDLLKGVEINDITPVDGTSGNARIAYCDSVDAVKYTQMYGYCPTYESYQAGIAKESEMGRSYLLDRVDNPDYAIWWYSCIQPVAPYPCLFVNANLIQKRANKWCEYLNHIKGELYYMCNRTQEYHDGTSTPLTEAQILSGEATYEGTYGDGNLIYPVHKTYGLYDPNLFWISSLRIDNIAESLDDYNYIAYADELINIKLTGSEKTTYSETLNALLDSVTDGPGLNTKDSEFFFNKRIDLGNLVVELAKK